ncbi:MAG: hypothetical protein KC464_18910 [Myxococcales bacterium]|nr:hypothetical protein [Myxococcales bacterium]
MKFHGRLGPGRLTDAGQVLELRLHAPARAAGLTIKIWEMDTFPDEQGGTTSEGSEDDLLATFTGDLETAPGSGGARGAEWRAFTVTDVVIEEAKPDVARFKLRILGTDTVYEIPILSEADEAEGDDYELGFSIEHGGAEQFRTRTPALVALPRDPVRVLDVRFGDHADGAAEPDPDTLTGKLDVLGNGHLDQHGYLVVHPAESDDAAAGEVKQVRRGRPMYLYVHDDDAPFELGPSTIPIALCDRVGDDGVVRRTALDRSHPSGTHLLEQPRGRAERDGRLRFDPAPQEVEGPRRHDPERARAAFARLAARLRGRTR